MRRTEGAQAKRAPAGRLGRSLNLIHRNNSPKPAFMRVSGRLNFLIRPARALLYAPVNAIPYLPGGPLRWLWIARLVVRIDQPLRAALIDWRGLNDRA